MPYILVNNLPAIWGIWVPFLGGKDPLEEGNPFQYSCLENPRSKGDWWTTVYGVAKSPTGWVMDSFTLPCAHGSEEWASWKQVISWLSRATVCASLKESRQRRGDKMWSQDPEVLSPHLFPKRREKKMWTLHGCIWSRTTWIHPPTPTPQESHPSLDPHPTSPAKPCPTFQAHLHMLLQLIHFRRFEPLIMV